MARFDGHLHQRHAVAVLNFRSRLSARAFSEGV